MSYKGFARSVKNRIGSKMNVDGLAWLAELCTMVPKGEYWDLGTYKGASAAIMGEFSNGHVFTVDNYQEGTDAKKNNGPYPRVEDVYLRLAEYGICIMRGETHEKAAWARPPVALVFVDADHTRKGVERDIAAWKPLVMVGGIMAFDDYGNPRWPDVKPVVDEHFADWEPLGVRGTVAAFRRVD